MRSKSNTSIPPRIVFYDGDCGLCQRAIQFLLNRDIRGKLHYAPLQGDTYDALPHPQKLDPSEALSGGGTLIYLRENRLYFRSTAALKALEDTGGIWKLTFLLLLIPPPIRDFVYRVVAHNRLKLFGQADSCRLPSADESNRFLT